MDETQMELTLYLRWLGMSISSLMKGRESVEHVEHDETGVRAMFFELTCERKWRRFAGERWNA